MEERLGHPLRWVSLGGGLEELWVNKGHDFEGYRQELAQLPAHIEKVHEFGRAIFASAGVFVTKVIAAKSIEGQRYVICDGGMAQAFLLAQTENTFRKYRKLNTREVIDHAITSTISRTVITHGSTQLMVLSMLLFGGPTLHYFAVALTIGILFGIYSSVFVAAAIAMWLGVKREDLVKASGKEHDPNDPNAGAVV